MFSIVVVLVGGLLAGALLKSVWDIYDLGSLFLTREEPQEREFLITSYDTEEDDGAYL